MSRRLDPDAAVEVSVDLDGERVNLEDVPEAQMRAMLEGERSPEVHPARRLCVRDGITVRYQAVYGLPHPFEDGDARIDAPQGEPYPGHFTFNPIAPPAPDSGHGSTAPGAYHPPNEDAEAWIEDAQYMGPGYTIRQDEDGRPQVFIQAPYPEPERVQGDVVLSEPDDGQVGGHDTDWWVERATPTPDDLSFVIDAWLSDWARPNPAPYVPLHAHAPRVVRSAPRHLAPTPACPSCA